VHVLIIGGGTGGMCLAHGLKQAGVQVTVYERDRTRAEGLHGYRVGINPTGNRALQQCLPPELFDTYLVTRARSPRATTSGSPSGCSPWRPGSGGTGRSARPTRAL
jgi:2-polyprenyl-6-methoxyphenol hydroxylase-like FAD-dependent oxidoreductase